MSDFAPPGPKRLQMWAVGLRQLGQEIQAVLTKDYTGATRMGEGSRASIAGAVTVARTDSENGRRCNPNPNRSSHTPNASS